VKDLRDLASEFLAVVTICLGAAVIGVAFKAGPIITVVTGLLVSVVVGIVLFNLARPVFSSVSTARLIARVIFIMGLGFALVAMLWFYFCSCEV
jgi:hypothetical protein